ncbi:hypothetical protein [Streptomyces chromofuscus]|uniref:Uncharacterized protein n=1 Tax=Streptomyces chromofuscus TaxID=42881 RepID=A0A7M2T9A2_STRCW|nr:hypothetical protein [Streptomyces chromofuscus]QOV45287.1 hypothetical protein IPT68_04815 [Streptomyces chromofuscus]GGS98805.1 hypothetical protein GCM10010254_18530 [Streptomyces chromofuscus]
MPARRGGAAGQGHPGCARLTGRAAEGGPEDKEIARLKAETARLKAEPSKARTVLEVHEELSVLLDQLATYNAPSQNGEKKNK